MDFLNVSPFDFRVRFESDEIKLRVRTSNWGSGFRIEKYKFELKVGSSNGESRDRIERSEIWVSTEQKKILKSLQTSTTYSPHQLLFHPPVLKKLWDLNLNWIIHGTKKKEEMKWDHNVQIEWKNLFVFLKKQFSSVSIRYSIVKWASKAVIIAVSCELIRDAHELPANIWILLIQILNKSSCVVTQESIQNVSENGRYKP